MKQPVTIPVSVALSDKEYCYPSWMRSQSIASASPPLLSPVPSNISLTVCLRPFIILKEGRAGRKMSDTLWELSVSPKNTTE